MTLNQNAMCLTRISGPRQDQSSHREKHDRWRPLLYSSSHANDATFHSRQFDDRKKRFWRGREMIAEDATGTGGPSCSPGQFSHHQSKADFSFLRTGTRRKCHSFRGERRRHRALLRLSSPLLFFPLQGEMPPPFHVPNRFQLSQNYNSGKKGAQSVISLPLVLRCSVLQALPT